MSSRQITLRDLWQIVSRRKFWLFFPIVVVTGVAFGGSFLLPVVYESQTKIAISELKFISPDLERLLPDEVGGLPARSKRSSWLAETRSEITSSGYINQMIEILRLAPSEKVLAQAISVREKFPENSLSATTRALQVEELKRRIDVNVIGENQIVITCRSVSPRQAADMATTLAQIYRDRKLSEQIVAGQEGRSLSDKQLAIAKRDFEEAETELADFKNSYIREQTAEGIASDANIRQVLSEIDATQLELNETLDRLNFLTARLNEHGIDTAIVGAAAVNLSDHLDNALTTTRSIASLMTKYVWRDAKIQGQLLKISEALDSIRAGGEYITATLYPSVDDMTQRNLAELIYRSFEAQFLQGKSRILGNALRQIQGILADTPYYDQMVKRLEEKAEEKRRTYELWQQQAYRLNIRQATTEAQAEIKYTVLEPATIPLRPASPNRLKIALMGLTLGLVLGCCALILSEVLDHSVRRIEDIEQALNLEVVGTIPDIKAASRVRNVSVG